MMSLNEGKFVSSVLIFVIEINRQLFACPNIWTGHVGLAHFLYCMVMPAVSN